jgi:hypothetical protein
MIGGVTYFGKVDQVRGQFFVATLFIHFMFIPLVPVGSYLFLGTSRSAGWRLAFSWKSLLFAYLRAALILGIVVALAAGLGLGKLLHAGQREWRAIGCGLAATGLLSLLLWSTYWLSGATQRRALQLTGWAGMPPPR